MTVTKTTISLNSGWNAIGMADAVKDAFIAAGWMAGWHSSYNANNYEHRILRIQHNASTTYGSSFYAFSFNTSQIYCSLLNRWDAATNTALGERWLDYASFPLQPNTGTTAYSNVSTGSAYTFRIYRSQLDPSFAAIYSDAFTIHLSNTISVLGANAPLVPWVDTAKSSVNGLCIMTPGTSGNRPRIVIEIFHRNRRSAYGASALINSTTESHYNMSDAEPFVFMSDSAVSGGYSSNVSTGSLYVPSVYAAVNTAWSANESPIVSGYPYHPLTTAVIPSDFGFWAPYGTTPYAPGDTVQIESGVNEWEIVTGTTQTQVDRTSLFLLARTI